MGRLVGEGMAELGEEGRAEPLDQLAGLGHHPVADGARVRVERSEGRAVVPVGPLRAPGIPQPPVALEEEADGVLVGRRGRDQPPGERQGLRRAILREAAGGERAGQFEDLLPVAPGQRPPAVVVLVEPGRVEVAQQPILHERPRPAARLVLGQRLVERQRRRPPVEREEAVRLGADQPLVQPEAPAARRDDRLRKSR